MIHTGQIYRDLDPRMEGRTVMVVANPEDSNKVTVEVLTNATDVQKLLDDETPGTRQYTPKDRRGTQTHISKKRLEEGKAYALVEQAPEISGPAG